MIQAAQALRVRVVQAYEAGQGRDAALAEGFSVGGRELVARCGYPGRRRWTKVIAGDRGAGEPTAPRILATLCQVAPLRDLATKVL